MRTIKKIFNTTVSVKEGASRSILRGIVQHDTLNEVNIRLSDGSKAFDYYGYTSIIFKVLKADGTSYIDSEGENVIATSPEDGIVTVILKGQATAAAGLCQAVIEIYADGEKMTTARLTYEVFEELGVDEDAVISEDDYPVLQNLMFSMENGYVTRAERAATAAKGSASNAKAYAEQAKAIAGGNFAPAGYGYGGEPLTTVIAAGESESDATYAARYDAIVDKMLDYSTMQVRATPPQLHGGGRGVATIYKDSNDYVTVVGDAPYLGAGSGYWRLVKNYGKWKPIEYSNPPMQVGVEYRTTERYMGKPVYAKLVNAGVFLANDVRPVVHGISDIENIVSATGNLGNVASLPYVYGSTRQEFCVNKTTVYLIGVSSAYTAANAMITVKYTKTTDT